MSTTVLNEAIKKNALQLKEEKTIYKVNLRFNLKDEKEKLVADAFQEIVNASGLSDNKVAIELIESGIEQLSKASQ